ncbi:polar amino acid transport system substrate-binding protein [Mesorhizobium soli]|uniref:transporter substrate-binding domain-containing protein n=1 Tax=Pseudaminobacter soli (ex Li et al. 2025) TaxID=1295366 RepID=UPI00247331A9|nr:transporter substrate-binding domain-containing protein [Mesorhizobium soli]MDH6233192.1 polar amino acid transport system substrate-binding protein [Mesorhizobium soli]
MDNQSNKLAGLLCGTVIALALGSQASAAASDKPEFASGGTLKVCTAGDFPPMQYYKNPGDADLVGFEVDVIDAIAKQWGAKTEFVVGDFKGLLPSLDSQRCDLVASGIMITPARLEKYDGVPYFGSHVVLLVPSTDEETKKPEDMSGKLMAIEAGTTYEGTVADLNAKLASAGKDPVEMQTYPSASGVIEQILVGRAASTITQDTTAAFRMMQMPDRLKIAYTYDESETYGIYMRKNSEDRKMVKEAIEALQQSGEMKALLAKWSLPATSTDVAHD